MCRVQYVTAHTCPLKQQTQSKMGGALSIQFQDSCHTCMYYLLFFLGSQRLFARSTPFTGAVFIQVLKSIWDRTPSYTHTYTPSCFSTAATPVCACNMLI